MVLSEHATLEGARRLVEEMVRRPGGSTGSSPGPRPAAGPSSPRRTNRPAISRTSAGDVIPGGSDRRGPAAFPEWTSTTRPAHGGGRNGFGTRRPAKPKARELLSRPGGGRQPIVGERRGGGLAEPVPRTRTDKGRQRTKGTRLPRRDRQRWVWAYRGRRRWPRSPTAGASAGRVRRATPTRS
jgi:hypothetical protein